MIKIIRKINKKRAVIFCIAVIILFILLLIFSSLKNCQSSQAMADRWSSDGTEYAQVSVFYPDNADMYSKAEIERIRTKIDERMDTESYKPLREGAKVWLDAYSTAGELCTVYSGKTSTVAPASDDSQKKTADFGKGSTEVSLVGVSENFFKFHPLTLLSGNYIYDGELRDNRVVLDEGSAWAVFSSVDVVGMKLSVNGIECEVAGVVRHESEKVTEHAYPKIPIVYAHYDLLSQMKMNNSISCYETVMPNPVENYAKNILLDCYGINVMSESDKTDENKEETLPCVIIDNTNRYSVLNLFTNVKKFGKNLVVSKKIVYPYWENAARIMTARLSLVFVFISVFMAFVIIIVLGFIGKLYLNRTWHLKDYIEKFKDKYTYKKKTSDYIQLNEEDLKGKDKKYE